jgi:hypothetical protein
MNPVKNKKQRHEKSIFHGAAEVVTETGVV